MDRSSSLQEIVITVREQTGVNVYTTSLTDL